MSTVSTVRGNSKYGSRGGMGGAWVFPRCLGGEIDPGLLGVDFGFPRYTKGIYRDIATAARATRELWRCGTVPKGLCRGVEHLPKGGVKHVEHLPKGGVKVEQLNTC